MLSSLGQAASRYVYLMCAFLPFYLHLVLEKHCLVSWQCMWRAFGMTSFQRLRILTQVERMVVVPLRDVTCLRLSITLYGSDNLTLRWVNQAFAPDALVWSVLAEVYRKIVFISLSSDSGFQINVLIVPYVPCATLSHTHLYMFSGSIEKCDELFWWNCDTADHEPLFTIINFFDTNVINFSCCVEHAVWEYDEIRLGYCIFTVQNTILYFWDGISFLVYSIVIL